MVDDGVVNTVTGRFAEARLYLTYALALLRPGVRVPTFASPRLFAESVSHLSADDLKVLVEESRRALDQQETDLERIRSRSVNLLTIGLTEVAAVSALAPRAFTHGPLIVVSWSLGAVLIVLALGGAGAILTSRAQMGSVDPRTIAYRSPPILRAIALEYLQSLGESEVTVRTRLTVLRDAVLLQTVAALLLAAIWPFTR
jgi:hypothetical protein